MRRRLWVSVALTVVLVMSALLLAACDPQVTLGDIFVSYTSEGEITRAELQFTLPVGWTVLTDSAANYSSLHADSDIGYVKSLGAYIVTDGDGNLNLVRPDGEGGAVFMLHGSDGGTAFGAEAIVVKGDLVLMRINNGSASVVDLSTGREVLTQSETTDITVSKKTGIEDAVRILDDELIAVAPAYSSAVAKGQTAYTPVYRASTGGLAAMVYNPGGSLEGVYGFDGEYVTVEADTTSSSVTERATFLYRIPASGGARLKAEGNMAYDQRDPRDDYFTESLYLGDGRIYVHEEWTVSSSSEYSYSYDGEYYKVQRFIVNAEDGTREQYSSQHYFLNCVTNRYDYSGRSDVVPSTFLKDGYIYSSFGLYVPADTKEAEYDQYVLDTDLNVVLSLTNNWGIELEYVERDKVNYYDLMLQFQDGYGYAPLAPAALRLFDESGKIVAEETAYELTGVNLHDGMIIAGTADGSNTLYGAFDLDCELVIPFEYKLISPFRGFYTYARRSTSSGGTETVLLGKDGSVVETLSDGTKPFHDIATTSKGSEIYKRGCYLYKATDEDGTVRYGVKNFSADASSNTVLEACFLSGCVLYSPDTDNNLVFVFGQTEKDGAVSVYRMFGEPSEPAGGGLPVWAWVLIGVGAAAVVAGIVTGAVLGARRRKAGAAAEEEK